MSLQRQTGLTTLKDLRNIVLTRMEAKEKARGDLVLETRREGLTEDTVPEEVPEETRHGIADLDGHQEHGLADALIPIAMDR